MALLMVLLKLLQSRLIVLIERTDRLSETCQLLFVVLLRQGKEMLLQVLLTTCLHELIEQVPVLAAGLVVGSLRCKHALLASLALVLAAFERSSRKTRRTLLRSHLKRVNLTIATDKANFSMAIEELVARLARLRVDLAWRRALLRPFEL